MHLVWPLTVAEWVVESVCLKEKLMIWAWKKRNLLLLSASLWLQRGKQVQRSLSEIPAPSQSMGWSWDQEKSRQQRGTRPKQLQTEWKGGRSRRPEPTWSTWAWWTDEVPLCPAFCQQAAHTPSSISDCTAMTAGNMVASVRVCHHSACPKRAVLWSVVCTSVCLSSYRLFVIITLCVWEVVCEEQSSLWLLSQHWLFCRVCQPLIAFISGWHTLLSTGFSFFFHFSTSPSLWLFLLFCGAFLTKYNIYNIPSSSKHLLRCF